jgi:hypothetical protein
MPPFLDRCIMERYRNTSVRGGVYLSHRGLKSRVQRESNTQSREIASLVFQRGRNDILRPPVSEGLSLLTGLDPRGNGELSQIKSPRGA